MPYQVKTSKEVDKFLDKHKNIAPKILKSLRIIAQNPYKNNLDIKRLQAKEHKYRLRIGKYRLLYEIIESQILIYAYKAQSRSDVYK